MIRAVDFMEGKVESEQEQEDWNKRETIFLERTQLLHREIEEGF